MFLRSLVFTGMAFFLVTSGFAQTIKLARVESAYEQVVAGALITEIYKRLGLTVKVQDQPGERATVSVLNGAIDGEVGRIESYAKRNPTLIKVEPSYYYIDTIVFAKTGSGIRINSIDDLKKYKVGIVRGVAHSRQATAGITNISLANNYESLYRMLEIDRVDIILDVGFSGSHLLKKLNITDIEVVGTLAPRLELFHILGAGKKDLALKLSSVIIKMKASGELAMLQKRFEQDLINGRLKP